MPAEATRENLRQSVADNRDQQALVQESRELLTDLMRNEMHDGMRMAVAEGIQAALTEDNARKFVQAVLAEFQAAATMKTGQIAGGLLKAFIGRVFLFVMLGSIVYAVGGWNALAALAKYLASGDPK